MTLLKKRSFDILLVEDNLADVRLTKEALKESQMDTILHVTCDGVEAMDFLRMKGKYSKEHRPTIILLDLNLPRKSGREVLAEIKQDNELRRIPVIILTSSKAEEDIVKAYALHANCYITKPIIFDQFIHIVKMIDEFWLELVVLPT